MMTVQLAQKPANSRTTRESAFSAHLPFAPTKKSFLIISVEGPVSMQSSIERLDSVSVGAA
jgi:hypothetical protein